VCDHRVVLLRQAFFLYDSKGFPLDLTQRMAEEAGLAVDIGGYHRCMEVQREMSKVRRSRASRRQLLPPRPPFLS
jgi:alanyl-tRNA synthetase